MGFDGSGGFTVNSTGSPVQPQTKIKASVFNAIVAELAAGLSLCVTRDGQSTITQSTDWNNQKITTLGEGFALDDAASILNILQGTAQYAPTVGGTANALVITPALNQIPSTLEDGTELWFVPVSTNTGAATLNYANFGAKNITKSGTVALTAGDLTAGQFVGVKYDGTRFQLISPLNVEGSWTPSLGGTATYTTQIGRYAKRGNVVSFVCMLVVNVLGTGSTSVISGLPFTSGLFSSDQAVTVGDFGSLASNVVWIGARVNNNATTITVRSLTAAGASAQTNAVIGNGTMLLITGSYWVT